MPKVGKSWFGGTVVLATYAALFLGNCGGESLNGSGTGGKPGNTTGGTTGTGGFLDGGGGSTGTGNARGTGGLATGGGGDWGGAGGDIGDCNVIITYAPILTVVDAANGNPICDPTFAILDGNAANPIAIADVQQCDGTSGVACPGSPGEAQPGPCRFLLNGLDSSRVTGLEVGAPGYLSLEVDGALAGVGGCVPYRAPSQLTVALPPALPVPSDGGADAI